jgi:hypothetical protein
MSKHNDIAKVTYHVKAYGTPVSIQIELGLDEKLPDNIKRWANRLAGAGLHPNLRPATPANGVDLGAQPPAPTNQPPAPPQPPQNDRIAPKTTPQSNQVTGALWNNGAIELYAPGRKYNDWRLKTIRAIRRVNPALARDLEASPGEQIACKLIVDWVDSPRRNRQGIPYKDAVRLTNEDTGETVQLVGGDVA